MQKKTSGIFAGIIFLIIGVNILWWNEGRTVHNTQAIKEARDNYIQVKSNELNEKNEGKLVSLTGKLNLDAATEVKDNVFDLGMKTAKLSRTSEMYQWEEDCEDDNCTYNKTWSEKVIDSKDFKENHDNPTEKKYESEDFYADNVYVGKYLLNENLLSKLSTKAKINNLQDNVKNLNNLTVNGNYLVNYSEEPNIGDIRVSFSYNNAKEVSILAVQQDGSFTSFRSKSGVKIYKLVEGNYTADEILDSMQGQNNFAKWLFRFLGTILIIASISSLFSPIQSLANHVPVLRTIVSYVSSAISSLIGLAISLVVIAIAWFRYRPILSISLIVIAVAITLFIYYNNKQKENKKEANPKEENKKPVS